MVRVATPACKQKSEIMIDGIDKFDRLSSPVLELLGSRGQLPDGTDEGRCRAGMGAIATVGNPQFPPQLFILDRDQLDPSGQHLVAGKAGTDQ